MHRSVFDDLAFARAGDAEIVWVDDEIIEIATIADLQASFARLRIDNDQLIADCERDIQRIDKY